MDYHVNPLRRLAAPADYVLNVFGISFEPEPGVRFTTERTVFGAGVNVGFHLVAAFRFDAPTCQKEQNSHL